MENANAEVSFANNAKKEKNMEDFFLFDKYKLITKVDKIKYPDIHQN